MIWAFVPVTKGTSMRHPGLWVFKQGVSATDIGYPLWMLWVVLALHHIPSNQVHLVPVYRRMDHLAPLPAWYLVALALAIAVVGAALTQRFAVLIWLYIGLACWWAALAAIAWTVGSGWLGLGFFGVFGVWAMVRQAQIGADMRLGQRRER
jgi:hypothetical protein